MQLKAGEEIVSFVSNLGCNGEGIVKTENYTIFVPFVLPEEKAKIKIDKIKKDYAFGTLTALIVPAEERVRPKCPVFGICGGCQLQHYKYTNQLKFKTQVVEECFYKIAHLKARVGSCVKSEKHYFYRNKFHFFVREEEGQTKIGLFKGETHDIVEINFCPIQPEWSADIIRCVKDFIKAAGIKGYNEKTGEGVLESVVVREIDSRFIVILITKSEIENINEFTKYLDKTIGTRYSLFINKNEPDAENYNEDIKGFKCIKGNPRIPMNESGMKFELYPNVFLQVNDSTQKKLYNKILKVADPDENTIVIDAYSGCGILTALFAKKAYKAYGIEIVPEAIACAEELKTHCELQGKMFNVLGKCEEEMPALLDEIITYNKDITVILDPPRKGCEKDVLMSLLKHKVNKIVYVSCNAPTLARDIGLLTGRLSVTKSGIEKNKKFKEADSPYSIELIQPFDMFPQTKHVETLVYLKRKNA